LITAIFFQIVCSIAFGLQLYFIGTASGVGSSDWIVGEGEDLNIRDRAINLSGNLVVDVGGRLTLSNVELVFNTSGYFEVGITLKEDAILEVYDSTIRGVDNLFLFKASDSTIVLENSTIRMTHVLCGNSTRVSLTNSDIWALHCFNETSASVSGSKLHYLFLRGNSSARVAGSHVVEILLYDQSEATVSDTVLKNVFYFDEGWATLSNCSYVDLIRFEPMRCDLTIEVLDEDSREPLPEVEVALNRSTLDTPITGLTDGEGLAAFSDLEEGDYTATVSSEGYPPVTARVTLLERAQRETVLMSREEGGNGRTTLVGYAFTSLGVVVTLLIVLRLQRSR
jgi:hypothetical protein